MVRASPQAAWVAASERAKKAKIIDAAAPAMAPISIMPSTPRLMTPLRSTTSSPRPAKISGVAAARVPARMGSRDSIMVRASGGAAEPVIDEGICPQQEEKQHALEDAGDGSRHLQTDLGCLAAQIDERA